MAVPSSLLRRKPVPRCNRGVMSSPGNEDPPLCLLGRDPAGFFQPDFVEPWLGCDYGGSCGLQRVLSPGREVCAQIGARLNRGDGGEYGVQVHYVGARFSAGCTTGAGAPAPEQGRMIGAVLAPHHGQIPTEANFYCACDSIDEEITQVARVLLDQYSVEELFRGGSLMVVVEHEFVATWDSAKQQAALRLVVDHFACRWRRLRRVAIQVTVPSFSREALPTDPPALQLRYREALAAELERAQGFALSPLQSRQKQTGRPPDLLFSLDRRLDFDEGIVELLRKTGRLRR